MFDETDFEAIKEGKARNNDKGAAVTKETFGTLDQKTRAAICGSRMIARLIKAAKGHSCDSLQQYLADWNVLYFSNSENDAFLEAGIDALDLKCP